jgi:hypothetical protein
VSLLTLCQNVVNETGIGDAPATIISNTDKLAVQLLALAQKEVRILGGMNWQALVAEQTITTANGTDNYALPTDWDRYVSDTFWDATNYWPMRGSIDPQQWQALKRGIVSATIRKRFRVKAGKVYIFPTPTAIESLIGEYIINTPVAASGGTKKTSFTVDTDTSVVPEFLVELGVKWRILQAKGLDYTDARDEYDDQVRTNFAQDVPAPTLNDGIPTETTPTFWANLPQQIVP